MVSDQAGKSKGMIMAKRSRKSVLQGLGPTGDFPDGKLDPHDEGGINIGVGRYMGKVILNFGSAVKSLGFSPEEARDFAELIKKHAGIIDQQASTTRSHKKKRKV